MLCRLSEAAGEKITWEGTVTLEPFQSEGRLVFEDYQLPRLWTYVQDQVRFQIPQGLLTMKGHYRLSTTDQGCGCAGRWRDPDGSRFTDSGERGDVPVITIPLFEVNGVSVDVAKQDVRIPSITVSRCSFHRMGRERWRGELSHAVFSGGITEVRMTSKRT